MTETQEAERDTQQKTTSAPGDGRAVSLKDQVKSGLEAMRPQLQVALPSHISPERFERTVLTALNLNPELLKCDRRSLFNACAKAASDGLLPDGREGALVPFKGQATWMPMVYGIIKKARQSGELAALSARIVYQKEIDEGRFKYRIVDGVDSVEHDPILFGERGKAVLVYAAAVFKDGHKEIEPLHADDVAKIRAMSRASTGPWHAWPEEMWKKSAIRRLAKRLPLSAELFDTISRDDTMTEFERQRLEAKETALQDAGRQLGAAPMLTVGEAGEVYDTRTGEVQDDPSGQTDTVDAGGIDPERPDELADWLTDKLRDEIDTATTVITVNRVEKEIAPELTGRADLLERLTDACEAKRRALSVPKGKK